LIVVDTNVLAPLSIAGPRTAAVERLHERDPDWLVPPLWRYELRNVLVRHCRAGIIGWAQAGAAMTFVEAQLEEVHDIVDSDMVFLIAQHTRLTAYDAEFAVLAEGLDLPLLTWDGELLRALPGRALTPEEYLASR
jgi:predicted nucleic acid-binding protein